jgi:hypothetical protein
MAGTFPWAHAQFPKTDLLGALLGAAQVFEHGTTDRKKVLIIFSDMRQANGVLEGVDASGKSVNYWQTLRDVWIEYFALAGATVEDYSILRQLPR